MCTYFGGWEVTEEQLAEVAELSDVLADNDDYLSAEFRNKCEQVIADPLEIDVSDFAYAFRYLKENVDIHVHAQQRCNEDVDTLVRAQL